MNRASGISKDRGLNLMKFDNSDLQLICFQQLLCLSQFLNRLFQPAELFFVVDG